MMSIRPLSFVFRPSSFILSVCCLPRAGNGSVGRSRMRPSHPAAGSWLTWGLATLLMLIVDAVVAHTPLIWGKTTIWVHDPKERLERLAFWQTYDVARTLYRPQPPAALRVAILGNSLVWFPAQPAVVARELRRAEPGLDVRVDNLSFFGAKIGDLEIVSRQLPRLDPSVVVLALGGSELVPTTLPLVNPTGRRFDVGWADGPLPPASQSERLERWLRTAWPLYRLRAFARDGLANRLRPATADQPVPEHFASTADVLAFLDPNTAAASEAALERFRQERTIEAYVAFLRARWLPPEPFDPLPAPETLTLDSPGAVALDRLLARLAAGPWTPIVLLTPENPLLDLDTAGRYHRLGFSDRAAGIIETVAARHGVRVVDGRRWMPADAFMDFLHLFPDVSGFQVPLAEEIRRAAHS